MSYSSAKYHRQNDRYYKIKENGSNKDILEADKKAALEKGDSGYHDHYYKRNGRWYVQTKIASRHLFEQLKPGIEGVECAEYADYLDHLFEELRHI